VPPARWPTPISSSWRPEEARITEIGAVRFAGGRVTREFCMLINPGHAIPPDIAELTGISDAMVRRAPYIQAVLPSFLAFASGCVLAAHNAPFDLGFLTAACGECGLPWPQLPVLDTVALARQVLDEAEVPDCKLSTLASYFGAPTPPCHRALADARATAAVLDGLIGRLTTAGVRTLAGLRSYGDTRAAAGLALNGSGPQAIRLSENANDFPSGCSVVCPTSMPVLGSASAATSGTTRIGTRLRAPLGR
jgi:DNA polymerase III epsilon subunit family exonuclease